MADISIEPSVIRDVLKGILYSLLIIFVMYTMPIIGIFAWVILPLPVLFYRLKIGRNATGIIMVVCLIVLSALTHNIVFSALYFGSFLLTGFLLGEFIEKHLGIEKILSFTCLILFGTFALLLIIYAFHQGHTPGQLLASYVSKYQSITTELISQSKQLYPDVELDLELYQKITELLMMTLPGILFSTYMVMALFNTVMIRKLLAKNNITVQSIENLILWKSSDYMVFILIGLSMLILVPAKSLQVLFINCVIILLTVYFLQGLAVVSFFFEKKSAPLAAKIFFYILIALQPLFSLLITGVGIFDTWINFRKLDTAT